MKYSQGPSHSTKQRRPAAERDGARPNPTQLAESPYMVQQRKTIDAIFGQSATQRVAEDEELVQGKFDTAQRQAPEDEELIQGKFATAQRQGPEEEELVQGKFDTDVSQRQETSPQPTNQTGMPDNLKTGIESLSGMDMNDVKVHRNSDKPSQLNALAYAQGNDIHLAPGQEQHLPHEAWHVVQQRQGRVQPTQTIAGQQINDDASLEHEADSMGAKALQTKTQS